MDSVLQLADAVVLTGGPDIQPKRYGGEAQASLCHTEPRRDSTEFFMYTTALEKQLPIFGICRGLQLINVAQGGSLLADIPSMKGSFQHHKEGSNDAYHPVVLGAAISDFKQGDTAEVNSSHHQGILVLGNG